MPERNTAPTSGPKATNQGRRTRSESQPKSGCEREEEIEARATSEPTRVRLKSSLVTRRGRSGEKKLE